MQNKSMSTKIYQKVHVFGECALGEFLEGFWEGFWDAQKLDFPFFFHVVPKQNLKLVLDRSKIASKKKKRSLAGVVFGPRALWGVGGINPNIKNLLSNTPWAKGPANFVQKYFGKNLEK